mgnify:CR=1 FL=1
MALTLSASASTSTSTSHPSDAVTSTSHNANFTIEDLEAIRTMANLEAAMANEPPVDNEPPTTAHSTPETVYSAKTYDPIARLTARHFCWACLLCEADCGFGGGYNCGCCEEHGSCHKANQC